MMKLTHKIYTFNKELNEGIYLKVNGKIKDVTLDELFKNIQSKSKTKINGYSFLEYFKVVDGSLVDENENVYNFIDSESQEQVKLISINNAIVQFGNMQLTDEEDEKFGNMLVEPAEDEMEPSTIQEEETEKEEEIEIKTEAIKEPTNEDSKNKEEFEEICSQLQSDGYKKKEVGGVVTFTKKEHDPIVFVLDHGSYLEMNLSSEDIDEEDI